MPSFHTTLNNAPSTFTLDVTSCFLSDDPGRKDYEVFINKQRADSSLFQKNGNNSLTYNGAPIPGTSSLDVVPLEPPHFRPMNYMVQPVVDYRLTGANALHAIVDTSVFGNHLRLTGNTTTRTQPARGVNKLTFSEGTELVLPSYTALNAPGGFTVVGMFEPASVVNAQGLTTTVLNLGTAQANSLGFQYGTTSNEIPPSLKLNYGVRSIVAESGILLGKGIHLFAVSGNSATMTRFFLNGLRADITTTSVSTYTVQSGQLGNSGNGTQHFIGSLSNRLFISNKVYILSEYKMFHDYYLSEFPVDRLTFDGDSLTYGLNVTNWFDNQWTNRVVQDLNGNWSSLNLGISGQTIATMLANAPAKVDTLRHPMYGKDVVVLMAGINDIIAGTNATTIYNNIVSYCTARRQLGFKVVVLTITARGTDPTHEATRVSVNNSIRTNWRTFADALADTGADPIMGNNTQTGNTTFFQDGVHYTPAGCARISPYVVDAVRSL